MSNKHNRKSEKFWDKQAKSYDKEEAKDADKYQDIITKTIAYLKPDDTVLEIGCGTGKFSNQLAKHVNSIDAIDISGKMIEVAEVNAGRKGINNVNYFKATIEDDRLKPASYDVVFCFYLLHLLDNPEEAMSRIKTLLKPGGLLISVTPCMGEKSIHIALFSVLGKIGLLPKISLFKNPELEAIISNTGLTINENELVKDTSNQYFILAKKV